MLKVKLPACYSECHFAAFCYDDSVIQTEHNVLCLFNLLTIQSVDNLTLAF